ncbi:MAG: hypothetical protein IKB04_04845 [Clostridia bacterium]|nr:hypothetical protein [Clostridia bacterium]
MDETPIRQDEQPIEPPKPEKKPAKRKKKRGHIRYAAPLGFLVLLFAVVGVISTIVGGVNLVKRWADDTPLREELSLALDPVMQLCPPPFDDAGTAEDQDTLLMAAIYDIAETERIRQLREKDDTCVYELEETLWRMIVPQADVEASFAALFGEKAIREHKTVGEAEYDAAKACYYVPLTLSTSGYVPVLDTLKKQGDGYSVRVAYVSNADVAYDLRGNAIAPTAAMSKYAQWFTVEKTEDGRWIVVSVTAE